MELEEGSGVFVCTDDFMTHHSMPVVQKSNNSAKIKGLLWAQSIFGVSLQCVGLFIEGSEVGRKEKPH